MPRGLIEVVGSIPLDQFWPAGASDADTVKVRVDLAAEPFRFRSGPGSGWRRIRWFDDAWVVSQVGRKRAVDGKGRLTVRLQGIDAPELHYRPRGPRSGTPEVRAAFRAANREFRQCLAEAATLELRDLLGRAAGGSAKLPCLVRSAVDDPEDVFDAYGRFVGDIWLRIGGVDVDVNLDLVEAGWAAPAYYVSMSEVEIREIDVLAREAARRRRGLWRYLNVHLHVLAADGVFVRRPAGDVGFHRVPAPSPAVTA